MLETSWVPQDLTYFLSRKNGTYACYSSFHLYPAKGDEVSIETMNRSGGWKSPYTDLVRQSTVFACDVFGDQYFASTIGSFFKLSIETGEVQEMGPTLEDFFASLLADLALQTGYPLALEWQERNGPLAHNYLLSPKIPFFLGGKYEIDNLWHCHALERVAFASDLFLQTKDLPDGQQISLVFDEEDNEEKR